jgi:CheY-like chemotaxis protein
VRVVTKGIVDAHGGSLSVYSAGEGHGSTFTLQLPMKPRVHAVRVGSSHISTANIRSSHSPVTPQVNDSVRLFLSSVSNDGDSKVDEDEENESQVQSIFSHRSRILVVDDSKTNRKMMCRFLEVSHICEEAVDGENAVDQVRAAMETSRSYAAILMDYQMPIMDGPTAIREIRRLGYRGPIIGVTGNALPCDRDVMVSAGANLVLTKPVDPDMLEELLRGEFDVLVLVQGRQMGRVLSCFCVAPRYTTSMPV